MSATVSQPATPGTRPTLAVRTGDRCRVLAAPLVQTLPLAAICCRHRRCWLWLLSDRTRSWRSQIAIKQLHHDLGRCAPLLGLASAVAHARRAAVPAVPGLGATLLRSNARCTGRPVDRTPLLQGPRRNCEHFETAQRHLRSRPARVAAWRMLELVGPSTSHRSGRARRLDGAGAHHQFGCYLLRASARCRRRASRSRPPTSSTPATRSARRCCTRRCDPAAGDEPARAIAGVRTNTNANTAAATRSHYWHGEALQARGRRDHAARRAMLVRRRTRSRSIA